MKGAFLFAMLLFLPAVSSGFQSQNYINDFMNGYNFTRGNYRQDELLEIRRRELEIQQRQLKLQQDSDHREQQRYEQETNVQQQHIPYSKDQIDRLKVERFYIDHPQYSQGVLSKKLIETAVSLKELPEYKNKSPYDILMAAHDHMEQPANNQANWRKEQEEFFSKHPEYKDSPLRWNALNNLVIKLATMPSNASKTGAEILEAAHAEVEKMK